MIGGRAVAESVSVSLLWLWLLASLSNSQRMYQASGCFGSLRGVLRLHTAVMSDSPL